MLNYIRALIALTISSRPYTFLIAVLLFTACSESAPKVPARPQKGMWHILFDIGEVQVPISVTVSDSVWTIHNAAESITLDSIEWSGNTFRVKMPLFHTSLSGEVVGPTEIRGQWTDHTRDSLYQVPFLMRTGNLYPGYMQKIVTKGKHYECVFSGDNPEHRYMAVAVMDEDESGNLQGTFLTESGDFRYLQGNSTGQSIQLSCFDGAHLFHFCANLIGDSLTDGKFYSGRHWVEPWRGVVNPNARLRNPDSLTFLTNSSGLFQFRARTENGDSVVFDKESFTGKVSVVQIYGSWCPNCTDESIFLKQLYDKYHSDGLQVIPVAFERSEDFEKSRAAVKKQFSELNLPYASYYGGKKEQCSKVFSDLSKIISYPTAIIVDKKGKVRKIHTGFYGPGTGDYYERYTEMLDMFVAQLLKEI